MRAWKIKKDFFFGNWGKKARDGFPRELIAINNNFQLGGFAGGKTSRR